MYSVADKNTARKEIEKQYKIALFSYSFPFILLVLFILDSNTFNWTEMLFAVLFVFSLLPASVTGLIFSYKGYKLAKSNKDLEKKDIGYANLIMGIILVILGLLGTAIIFLMVG